MGGGKTHSMVLLGPFVAQYPRLSNRDTRAQLPIWAQPPRNFRPLPIVLDERYTRGPLSHRQVKKKGNEAWSIRDKPMSAPRVSIECSNQLACATKTSFPFQ